MEGVFIMETKDEEVIGKYEISNVTPYKKTMYNGIGEDYWNDGYNITLTNVKNPFDYFIQYVPELAYSKEQFKIGRVIELVE